MRLTFSRIFFIVVMILTITPVKATGELGSSCLNPIALTEDFQMTVSEPGSYWFSAGTYDLPLKVRYTPNVEVNKDDISIYVDFTCTPGVYDDPNLYELTDMASGWGIEMPIKFNPQIRTVDGEMVFEVNVDEDHRELMRQFGISYDVSAKVEVALPAAGVVELIPDTVFRNCIESSHWIYLPDTVATNPMSSSDTYVLPISDWTNDSVRLTWSGKEYPVTIWVGKDCGFTLDETDGLYACKFEITPSNGEAFLDLTSDMLKDLSRNHGSLLYAKVVSLESASLVFDYKPLSPEMERAISIELNKPVPLYANNLEQYYYFRTDLADQSLVFEANLKDTIVAHFGNTPTFGLQSNQYIGSYTFYPTADGSELALSKKQISTIAKSVVSDHIFVTFDAPAAATLTLSAWDASQCVDNSIEILPDGSVNIAANASSTIYRIDYTKWNKGDVELYWAGSQPVYTYLADTCSFALKADDPHVLNYKVMAKNSTYTITKLFMDSLANRVDADGYLYFRFNTRRAGTLTTTLTLDSAFIPQPVSPCVEASTLLEPTAALTLNLNSAFDIYRIDYAAWLASGVKLVWTGASPLHTFVAKDCEFAVAIYHKDVVNYTEVPAEGNVILSKDILATLGQYVDEDGYLYIRFLTELEGALTTQVAE